MKTCLYANTQAPILAWNINSVIPHSYLWYEFNDISLPKTDNLTLKIYWFNSLPYKNRCKRVLRSRCHTEPVLLEVENNASKVFWFHPYRAWRRERSPRRSVRRFQYPSLQLWIVLFLEIEADISIIVVSVSLEKWIHASLPFSYEILRASENVGNFESGFFNFGISLELLSRLISKYFLSFDMVFSNFNSCSFIEVCLCFFIFESPRICRVKFWMSFFQKNLINSFS